MRSPDSDTALAATETRDHALDVVKGFLVIGMVLYHVGSFSIASGELRHLAIGVFLSFVSGSWVFATGYVVGIHYGPRFDTDRSAIAYRLASRGVKLLVLFLASNTLIMMSGFAKSSWAVSIDHLARVFLHGGGELSSFEILVGIGMLLLLSPLLLVVFRRFKIAVAGLLLVVSLLGSFGYGYTPNLWMLVCGAWGLWIGLAAVEPGGSGANIEGRQGLVVPAVLGAGILLHYGLFYYGKAGRADLAIYVLGVIAINGFVYYLARYLLRLKALHDGLRLLGRYSLFSYIWQMGIIWTLIHTVAYFGMQPVYLRDVVVVLFLLVVSVLFVDYVRRKFTCLDSLYRFVFA